MKGADVDRWIADAARRATLLWLAGDRLKRAIASKDDKKILKTAEKLAEAMR